MKCNNDIDTKCSQYEYNNENHLHSVSSNMVENAIQMLNKNKQDTVPDLLSDSFINGSKSLFSCLSYLFTVMLRHGLSSGIFDMVVFAPLVKNKRKNLNDSDNYRAIALNSCMCKILDYILLNYFKDVFKSSSRQFAYKQDYSTTLCTFILMETIQYYTKRNSNVILTFLDCSKAFDRIRYSKLFNILQDTGLCPLVVRLLLVLYSNIEGHVRWDNYSSSLFKINCGVKQGGVISPILFTLYADILVERIVESKLGCYVGDVASSVLIYADDIVLMAPTRSAMQRLINICEKFGAEYNLEFNPDKCETLLVGFNNFNIELSLNGKSIPIKSNVKHLGHSIFDNRYLYDLKHTISDIKIRSNIISSNFYFLDTDSRVSIFNANCNSLYGSELSCLNSKGVNRLDCAWRICSRRILKVPYTTHCCFLPNLMNSLKPSHQITFRIFNFFKKGFNHDDWFIKFLFRNSFVNEESLMFRNIQYISNLVKIGIGELIGLSKNSMRKLLPFSKENLDVSWKTNFIHELLQCRDGILNNGLSYEQNCFLINQMCTN